jgi:pyruvate formate lyase activating enzyme
LFYKSRFIEYLPKDYIKCTICPRKCIIKPGERGFCGTKENRNGTVISLTYGLLSAISVDPIEKKPLSHFHPGSRSLSISSVGCSFTCSWCQNWHLSTAKVGEQQLKYVSPEDVVEMAHKKNCTSIAYTYNEPLINLNYVEDVSRLAKKNGICNVLVTNGYVSLDALARVVGLIDAANVDWKAFNNEFYRKHCSANLQSVLDATVYLKNNGVHVEVTYLIIPDYNDHEADIRHMTHYLVNNLDTDTPLHFSRFYPRYKFSHVPMTPIEILIRAREIAIEAGVRYVFIGNTKFSEYEDTNCPMCGKSVIQRNGYSISDWHMDEENNCEYCGYHIPLVGKQVHHQSMFF